MTINTSRHRQIVNTKRRIIVAVFIISLIGVSAAVLMFSNMRSSDGDLAGNVLIWHTYGNDDAAAFNQILDDYEQLNPLVNIHQKSFATPGDLLDQYQLTVDSGLGPDLFIGNAEWVTPLANSHSIDAFPQDVVNSVSSQYLPAAVQAFTYNDELYGLPLSLVTPALYYNKKNVDKPPETLDGLLTQAAEGHTVLLSTDFKDAFWGVQAFGGKFVDEEDRVILDQGGYANWLDWLMSARNAPGMILDANRASLQERFIEGDASYYVGYPSEIETLVESLGENNLGVAPLPSGPTGSAGPLLDVTGVLLGPSSSENQRDISVDLAGYLTNAEQSTKLMNVASQIPANSSVRINSRLHPIAAGFLAQARSAVRLPNTDQMSEAWSIADRAYRQVMGGVLSPIEAAAQTTESINQVTGMTVPDRIDPVCNDLGTIRLAHNWEGADADMLNELIASYRKTCPLVIVEVMNEDLSTTLARWRTDPSAATNPDIVLAPQSWLVQAGEAGIPLKDISSAVGNELLQRYLPTALQGMRMGNQLLGLPISARINVLYYNTALVQDPAHALESLRLQADDSVPIMLSAEFEPAFWGIGAFGGRLMDENDKPALHTGPFAEWMEWLKESNKNHGIIVSTTPGEVKTAFLDGTSAYYVGDPTERAELAVGIGNNTLGVALLPSGPEGPATPLFETTGFFFNDQLNDTELQTAMGFVRFMTDMDNQEYLVQRTLRMPTNSNVDLTDNPQTAVYLEQAKTALPIPKCLELDQVAIVGDQAYIDVLENGVDPALAAREVSIRMFEACGLDYAEDPILSNTPVVSPTVTVSTQPTTTVQASGTDEAPEIVPDATQTVTDTTATGP